MPQMLVALDFSLTKPKQIIIAGKADATDTRELIEEVHRHYLPDTIVLLADGGEGQKFLAEKLEEVKEMKPIDGQSGSLRLRKFYLQSAGHFSRRNCASFSLVRNARRDVLPHVLLCDNAR